MSEQQKVLTLREGDLVGAVEVLENGEHSVYIFLNHIQLIGIGDSFGMDKTVQTVLDVPGGAIHLHQALAEVIAVLNKAQERG